VRPAVGSETVASQHNRPDHQQIALALVDVPGLGGLVTVAGHPLRIGDGLTGALRVGKARHHGLPVDDEPAVGGVHHVRQPGDGLDEFDGVAEFLVGLAQRLPLI
jgi:hypothetical protein